MAPGAQAPSSSKTITEADCTAAKLGDSIPITAIGEPVSAVTLSAPRWNAAAKGLPPYCTVNGTMAQVDRAPNAKPINFQVAFPFAWNGRAAQLGGGAANVPIVNFSSLMLAPALIRVQEKPAANWVTTAKVNPIRGEFMRQCDKLDGLVDGIINNYMACRAIFDVKQGKSGRHPWAAKHCPNNVDPNPADTSAGACLTDGQIATLEFVYSLYLFAQPLASGVKTFGMWLPNTDPSGSGLIANARFQGQEGADENARKYTWLGELGVTAFLMHDLQSNLVDYVEGGKFAARPPRSLPGSTLPIPICPRLRNGAAR